MRLINPKYQAVIFDLFGTLVDNLTRGPYEKTLDKMAGAVGVAPEDFRRLWMATYMERNTGVHPNPQASIRYIGEQLNQKIPEAVVERATDIRLDFTIAALNPRPDAVPTLKQLRALGLKTGLISDCTGDVPMVWEKTPFPGLFDVTIFSCDVNLKKPDPRIYRLATEQLGVPPEGCLFVGDGGSGELTGAREAGMQPVLIRDPGDTPEEDFLPREDDWDGPRIAYLRELLNLLK